MGALVNFSGTTVGRLHVVSRSQNSGKHVMWECLCECGRVLNVSSTHLQTGHTRSCGCLALELKKSNKHGETHGMCETPEYDAWHQMKQRCLNPKAKKYPDYGGRGINVCKEWIDSFESFFSHIGTRPSSKHSLDRKDNNRGYEPGNVRWATIFEQNNNKRNSVANRGAFDMMDAVLREFNE